MIGKNLGQFHIVEQLGAGGMGVVYRAHDEKLERDVAIKVLPAGLLADEDARRRFRKEALALAKLNHPNIGTLFDFDSHDGTDFLVMEFVAGGSLLDKLSSGALSEKEIAALGVQIAAALEEAHEHGIVHRDLKPGNIALTPKGQVKVLDFGLAKLARPAGEQDATRSITEEHVAVGTLPYMAPEQLSGEPVDARTDIYALGVVLYEMATGRRPFQADTSPRLTDSILHATPPPPSRFQPRLNAELERIILKCLEKDPESRYQSAKEVAVDLRRLGAPSTRASETPIVAAPKRKMTLIWIGAVVAVLAVGIPLGLYFWPRGQPILSVAVLPFTNTTGGADIDHVVDGIVEEVINDLSQVSGLKVINRPTAFTYKGREVTPAKVGEELKVRAVVLGRVAQRGKQYTVQVDLVDTADGSELWGGQFQRTENELQSLHADLVRQIADKLRLRLTGEQQQRMAKSRTEDPEAYQLYLRGRFSMTSFAAGNIRDSVKYFEQAVAKDPNFALGWSGLADAYTYLGIIELQPPSEVIPKARQAALKALQLDEELGEAHASLGIIKLTYDWDYPGAEAELLRAIQLNPSHTFGRHWYAHYLELTGRLDEAIAEMKRIVELDPLAKMYTDDLVLEYMSKRQPDKALELARKWTDPGNADPYERQLLAQLYSEMGKNQEALAVLDEVRQKSDSFSVTGSIGAIYGRLGKRAEAQNIVAEMEKATQASYVPDVSIASVYFGLGDNDRGFAYIEKAIAQHSPELVFFVNDPFFDNLWPDPRYKEILRRINLAPYLANRK